MQPRPYTRILLGDGENRLDVEDANRVGGRDRVPRADRLDEVVAGVDEEHVDARRCTRLARWASTVSPMDAAIAKRLPKVSLAQRSILAERVSELGVGVFGELLQADDGGHVRAANANRSVKTLVQEPQCQLPWLSSCGRRSSSPQYGQ